MFAPTTLEPTVAAVARPEQWGGIQRPLPPQGGAEFWLSRANGATRVEGGVVLVSPGEGATVVGSGRGEDVASTRHRALGEGAVVVRAGGGRTPSTDLDWGSAAFMDVPAPVGDGGRGRPTLGESRGWA